MTSQLDQDPAPAPTALLARKNVLAGLMFIAVALLGLWLSRDYAIGTALRMGTGYVPRLLCWILLALGACVLVQGVREVPSGQGETARFGWRPLILVATSLALFGLTIERLGLVVAILLLIGPSAYATRDRGVVETLLAALVLIGLAWGIFIFGLQLTIRVWPEW